MLAGSDGPGGIYFDNVLITQNIGIVALVIILFSGGLSTDWKSIRQVLSAGIALAVLAVLVTALVIGIAAYILLDFSLLEGLLLGAIVSSTDAAAVFSILRARGVNLKIRCKSLLELESGSNDPMAVFLTLSFIQLLMQPNFPLEQLIPNFFLQMGIGALVGYTLGWLSIRLLNYIRLGFDGLYPVMTLTLALLIYSLASSLGGSGFLAVYLGGLTLGNSDFIHRRSMLRFFDGLSWLMQIAMFLTLGLLVFPSRLPAIIIPGLLIAGILIFVARPLGVFASLIFTNMRFNEKIFVAWVGLRGATPIVLATFPLLAGISRSETLFNMIFFVVLTSVMIQGPSIPLVARWLRVTSPLGITNDISNKLDISGEVYRQLRDLSVPRESSFAGKRIVELGLPEELLIILIERESDYVIPSGATEIHAGDKLLVISDQDAFDQAQKQANLS